jgi:glutathione S-transferase
MSSRRSKLWGFRLRQRLSHITVFPVSIVKYEPDLCDLRAVPPVIADPSSGPNGKPTYVSESFDIAVYLDDKYPAPKYPTVLPAGTRPLQKIFVEHYFGHIAGPIFPLIHPRAPELLDEPGQEYLYRTKGGKDKFAPITETEAIHQLAEACEKWEAFAQTLDLNGNGNAGPFVMGDKVTFVDFVVGGVLFFLHKVEGDQGKIWKEVMGWHDGKWAGLWKELKVIEKKSMGLP